MQYMYVLHAETENLGRQVLACMPAEFAVLPPMTPWSLVRQYGASMLPALVVFLWLRYLPLALNRFVVGLGCMVSSGGPLSRFNTSLLRLARRLELNDQKLEREF